ncbi:MAG: GWxTD domain-containing protein [Terriglobales bacterium]
MTALLIVACAGALAVPAWAWQKPQVTAKQRAQQAKKLQQELGGYYKKWLNGVVSYIISPEERKAFSQLKTNEERDQFIEAFWARRNPNPGTLYNSYKEQFYRRVAYANAHFAAGVAGWHTDRGRIYIVFGPPTEITSHPSGGTYERPMDEGGGETSTFPFSDWRYRYIPGIGQNITMEFVDTCMCGAYELTDDPSEKDALLEVPGAGLTLYEELGMSTKEARFENTDGTHDGYTPFTPESMDEFNRLETFAEEMAPPKIKFKDLEAVVNASVSYHLLPFELRTDYVKITDDTDLVPFTVQIPDSAMTFHQADGVEQGRIHILGQISTLSGQVVDTFENTVALDIPAELMAQYTNKDSRYWHGALLRPGRYKVVLALKDANAPDKMGTLRTAITVPHYTNTALACSSIVLADQIEPVPAKQVGTGEFIIGDTKVRPVVGNRFSRRQSMGIWMQVYNLKLNKVTHKPKATIAWTITDLVNHKTILHYVEQASEVSNAAEQLTLEKTLPLASMAPGYYRLTVTVTDDLTRQSVSPTSTFTVMR